MVVVTNVAMLQKQYGNGFPYTSYLSNQHYNPNLATDLTLCGAGYRDIRNARHESETECCQPMRSKYVILQRMGSGFQLCEVYVYSQIAGLMLRLPVYFGYFKILKNYD